MKSTSPVSGKEYNFDESKKDNNLNKFIESNNNKKIIAVQGLGFVGTVMSLVIANNDLDNYAVIGIDLKNKNSYWKIADINEGNLPIQSSDPLVDEYFQKTKQKDNFYATHDNSAFSSADVIIVDINLDVKKSLVDNKTGKISYDVPLSSFSRAIDNIGNYCKQDALILVETTVPPGTCKKIVEPAIIKGLKSRGLPTNEFKLGHSYERVMPGPNYINSIKNFYRVYSGIDERSADAVEAFLKTIISTSDYPLTRLANTQSTEMAKVLENSYRAMNISFMVEWSRFAENSGVNIYEVIDAIRLRPTHANLMYPGIGVGGYCLTKDPLLASWASEQFFGLDEGLSSSVKAVEINDQMPKYCYNFIANILKKSDKTYKDIGFLGVAYGPGIGDTRFSPVQNLYNYMEKDFNITCHDPYVKYWEELEIQPYQDIKNFLSNNFDCIVITTGHNEYIQSNLFYNELMDSKNNGTLIIDTIGLLDIKKLSPVYELGKNFFILGVGN
tara:strand:+ start:16784 stop:18283 length:1500 start_codon:yes stop_codon:yes gene_type:complete